MLSLSLFVGDALRLRSARALGGQGKDYQRDYIRHHLVYRAGKLQAQQEREQAQQQFNFAQAALEKAIEKKLESVDPDSYQMFIDNLTTLTPKEEDIFNLYVQGCSTKDIISQLGITENTLKYHNKNIYSKLGVKTRKELLQYIELMRNAEH